MIKSLQKDVAVTCRKQQCCLLSEY
uniref:Uncharacterized protein n=1 Tax=Arundo donax TaxID=35708 RepID=A0A0A9C4U5_ARUDO